MFPTDRKQFSLLVERLKISRKKKKKFKITFSSCARSGWADAAQPCEKVHTCLQSPSLRLRLGQPGRWGKPAELRLNRPRSSFPPEQHRLIRQRADGGTGLRAQHIPGGRQWHERSEVIT